MTRSQWVLSGLLVAQLVLVGLVALGRSGDAGGAVHPLIPELKSFTPERLEIQQPDHDPVVIERGAGGWTLTDPKGFPADETKVDELIKKLENLEVRRPVVTGDRYHEALEVASDKYQRRLRVWENGNDDPRVVLYVGSSPNFDMSNVRVEGSNLVYEVRGLGTFDLRTDRISWVKRSLVDVPEDEVTAISWRNGNGKVALARKDGAWSVDSPTPPAGKQLDSEKVKTFLHSITSLFFSQPAAKTDDPKMGFGDPVAALELTYETAAQKPDEGGEAATGAGGTAAEAEPKTGTVTIRVGNELAGGDGKRYASRSGFDYAVVLSKSDADKLTEKKLADLLAGS